MSSILKISALGLEETDYKVLSVAVDLLHGEGIVCTMLPGDNPGGHLVVIDNDAESSLQFLAQTRASQVRVLLSSHIVDHQENIVCIRRPIRVGELKELLVDTCQRMMTELTPVVGSAPTISPGKANHEATDTILTEHHAQTTLFQVLMDAKQQQHCLAVTTTDDCVILIDGRNGTVAAATPELPRKLLTQLPANLRIETIDSIEFAKHTQSLSLITLDTLLWEAGIEHAQNHLLQGHSLEQPVQLKIWPDFTRSNFRRSHYKLAAIMSRKAISLSALQKEADVPLEEVITFYNAAFAAGLIDPEVIPQKGMERTKRGRSPQRRNLIGLLARKLGLR
jgi:hypothetical protein